MTPAGLAVLGTLFFACQGALLALAFHRAVQLARVARRRPAAPSPDARVALPPVTVQLPVYNERHVVERLIAATGRLDYPRDRFEIQVLDDSTDDTCARVDRAVAALRDRGLTVRVLRRSRREGFKAGALRDGLAQAAGEWIAIFDADFVPAPDFLRRLAPHFADPAVGMVQARWGHLNRDHSALTTAQAVLLDAHFRIEQQSRTAAGLFLSFNGTSGIWRRRCIEDAGGWSSETLTEDLDLSYRAQLKGWRFVYDDAVVAPAELPADRDAFLAQQRRWAKGSIQTARKILPRVWKARLPWRQRLEAAAHLLGNGGYALTLALSLLLVPLLFLGPTLPRPLVIASEVGTLVAGLLPVTAFLVAGQRGRGTPWTRVARDVTAALILGAGLGLANGRAVLEALGREPGEWERTPKRGSGPAAGDGPGYRAARRSGRGEVAMALGFTLALAAECAMHHYRSVPFLLMLIAGYAFVATRPGPPRTLPGWARPESPE